MRYAIVAGFPSSSLGAVAQGVMAVCISMFLPKLIPDRSCRLSLRSRIAGSASRRLDVRACSTESESVGITAFDSSCLDDRSHIHG
jgi:hypothetical protein